VRSTRVMRSTRVAAADAVGKRTTAKPSTTIDALIDLVQPGRYAALKLTDDQRRALYRHRDGWLAKKVLTHLIAARAADGTTIARFPLTEKAFIRVTRRLGHTIGQKRARACIHLLRDTGLMDEIGSYRPAYTAQPGKSYRRVPIFRLGAGVLHAIRGARRLAECACNGASRLKFPVGSVRGVKPSLPTRWWFGGLFGMPDGRPPPGIGRKRAARMFSDDERMWLRSGGHPADD
jgi:hypothetical protein